MNTRIGIRLSSDERAKIETAMKHGDFKNLSDFVRKALEATFPPETSKA